MLLCNALWCDEFHHPLLSLDESVDFSPWHACRVGVEVVITVRFKPVVLSWTICEVCDSCDFCDSWERFSIFCRNYRSMRRFLGVCNLHSLFGLVSALRPACSANCEIKMR